MVFSSQTVSPNVGRNTLGFVKITTDPGVKANWKAQTPAPLPGFSIGTDRYAARPFVAPLGTGGLVSLPSVPPSASQKTESLTWCLKVAGFVSDSLKGAADAPVPASPANNNQRDLNENNGEFLATFSEDAGVTWKTSTKIDGTGSSGNSPGVFGLDATHFLAAWTTAGAGGKLTVQKWKKN